MEHALQECKYSGSIDDLVKVLFDDTKIDMKVEIVVPQVQCNKEMFIFCLEVFFKSICHLMHVDLSGIERVDEIKLDDISFETIQTVTEKIVRIGIHPNVLIEKTDIIGVTSSNVGMLAFMPDNLPLPEYRLVLLNGVAGVKYTVFFEPITFANHVTSGSCH